MKNKILAIFKNREAIRKQALKERVLKNKEGLLDAMGENIKGARGCPKMMMQKCTGALCENFGKYSFVTREGKESVYYRCAFTQTPLMIIEGNDLLRQLIFEQQQTQKAILTIGEEIIKALKENKG